MSALEKARAVADAVLYEGFLLYPYTASSAKNQLRWQFGVVMPDGYSDPTEPSSTQSQLLVQPFSENAQVEVIVRFLQQHDGVETTEREAKLAGLLRKHTEVPFTFEDLRGLIALRPAVDGQFVRLHLEITNLTQVSAQSSRSEALRSAFIGAHAIAIVRDGEFLSLLDPPEDAKDAASRTTNRRLYPVLISDGESAYAQRASVALASPIILYDFPQIASQSPTPMFDATEIDELLLLSVASLSDEEKRQACTTHERVRAIIERAEAMDATLQRRLHGRIAVGERVRVRPKRRADAIDMFVDGMIARVHSVHEDVDGRRYVSVLFESDPASDLHEWYGRSYFYEPDEIEPLDEAP